LAADLDGEGCLGWKSYAERWCGARIAVIPGDGNRNAVTPEAVKVIRAAVCGATQIEFVDFDWGADGMYATEGPLPRAPLQKLRDGMTQFFLARWATRRVQGNQHAADILLGLRFNAGTLWLMPNGGALS